MILIIDNYDSFTWNLAQALGVIVAAAGGDPERDIRVVRNDAITVDEILLLAPSHLCISPGPGTPDQAGITLQAIAACAGRFPILGVCLGHQAIGQAFGGRVVRAPRVMHGKTSLVRHDKAGLFEGLPEPLTVGRYHSLIVESSSLPASLIVTARSMDGDGDGDGVVMALSHRELPIYGVQFHPESVLTPGGSRLLANFLRLAAPAEEHG